MARPGISYEDVKTAATKLLEKGSSPSIQRVREVLGTGSNSTIGEHLKRWQQELAETPKVAPLPAVPEAVVTALEVFWQIAVENADALYQEQRAQATHAVVAAEQTRDEAIAAMNQAREEAARQQQQLVDMQATIRTLQDSLLVEQQQRNAAETSITAAQQRVVEVTQASEQIRTDAQARIATLENILTQTWEDMEQQLTQAKQRLSEAQQRSEASEQRLVHIIDQNRSEWAAERQVFSEQQITWRNKEVALQKQMETLQHEVTTSRLVVATSEERARLLDAEFTQAKIDLENLRNQHMEAIRTVDSLRGELGVAHSAKQALQQEFENCQDILATQEKKHDLFTEPVDKSVDNSGK